MTLLPLLFAVEAAWAGTQRETILLYPGYVTRIRCEGRLLLSSVGNPALVRLDALPREIGCGALVQPKAPAGRTNLVLETSTGTIERIVEVLPAGRQPAPDDLTYSLRGASK